MTRRVIAMIMSIICLIVIPTIIYNVEGWNLVETIIVYAFGACSVITGFNMITIAINKDIRVSGIE